jgi:uncharacterized protein YkwD
MRRLVVSLSLAISALVAAPAAHAAGCSGADAMPSTMSASAANHATLCLLNQQRRAKSLAPLRSNTRLQSAATRFSLQMVRQQFFDHTAPDGTTFDKRIVAAGYSSFAALAENIAWGSGPQATPAQIVNGWMHSPGHRRNILDATLRDIGIGIVSGAPQDTGTQRAATYTTDFGRRR